MGISSKKMEIDIVLSHSERKWEYTQRKMGAIRKIKNEREKMSNFIMAHKMNSLRTEFENRAIKFTYSHLCPNELNDIMT